MFRLLVTIAALTFATAALADDAAPAQAPADDGAVTTPAPATEDAPPAVDCTGLEGEALKACEQAPPVDLAAVPQEQPEDQKGGKAMQRSNDNRMEAFDDDE